MSYPMSVNDTVATFESSVEFYGAVVNCCHSLESNCMSLQTSSFWKLYEFTVNPFGNCISYQSYFWKLYEFNYYFLNEIPESKLTKKIFSRMGKYFISIPKYKCFCLM